MIQLSDTFACALLGAFVVGFLTILYFVQSIGKVILTHTFASERIEQANNIFSQHKEYISEHCRGYYDAESTREKYRVGESILNNIISQIGRNVQPLCGLRSNLHTTSTVQRVFQSGFEMFTNLINQSGRNNNTTIAATQSDATADMRNALTNTLIQSIVNSMSANNPTNNTDNEPRTTYKPKETSNLYSNTVATTEAEIPLELFSDQNQTNGVKTDANGCSVTDSDFDNVD